MIHSDDAAVDRFAVAMKAKLAAACEKGRGGWEQCDPAHLSRMLREHVEKGDPRDVANFCAFLWNLSAPITASMPTREPVEAPLSLIPDLVALEQQAVNIALLDMCDATSAWCAAAAKYREISSHDQSAFCDGYEAGMAAILSARASSPTASEDHRAALVERVLGMFEAWPKKRARPTEEPESQYRFGYNTALEDVLTALDAAPQRRGNASSPNAAGAEGAAIGEHDLSTSAGGRSYIAEFFAKRLRRHDFGCYINERLAADFACALAQYLRDQGAAPAQAAEPAAIPAGWSRVPNIPPAEVLEFYGDKYSLPVLLHDGERIMSVVARWDFTDDGWVDADFRDGPSPADYELLNSRAKCWMLLAAAHSGQPDPHDEVTDDDKLCADRYRYARDNIQEGHELPGGYWLSDTGDAWDKTIDEARAGESR
ncbi:hypothetical protein [Burkholderia stagnalis]|uniref:hypothetical protein n=1 Tax=Burkholderia stagnalis TaxID=1503054 RepID=UPI0021AB10A8|nr:hypothetical protein [Burkholderia stagnalis]